MTPMRFDHHCMRPIFLDQVIAVVVSLSLGTPPHLERGTHPRGCANKLISIFLSNRTPWRRIFLEVKPHPIHLLYHLLPFPKIKRYRSQHERKGANREPEPCSRATEQRLVGKASFLSQWPRRKKSGRTRATKLSRRRSEEGTMGDGC